MELVRDFKDLFWAFEMRRQTLYVSTIESHTRLDEIQVSLFQLSTFHGPSLPTLITKLCKARTVFAIDLAMSIP